MDLDLSPDQELLLETSRRFLAEQWSLPVVRAHLDDPVGFDRDALWPRVADLGWLALLAAGTDAAGRIPDGGAANLAIIAEAAGRALFTPPVLSTNVVAHAVATSGSSHLVDAHLDALADGREVAAWVVAADDRWAADATGVRATATPEGFRLDGVSSPVPDALVADVLLVTATTDAGPTQLLVSSAADGVTITPLVTLDLSRRCARVELRGVVVPAAAVLGRAGGAEAAIERQLALAVALQCAETVGATERAFEMALEYVKDRKSFGRPVGSYQAIKHRFADMLLWLETAKAVSDFAVKAVEANVDASEAASLAKVYVADRCRAIVRECLQFHGGIGFTWEHDIHLFVRRVESNAALYGDVEYHRTRLTRRPAGTITGAAVTAPRATAPDATSEVDEPPELHEYRLRARSWLAANLPRAQARDDSDPSPERVAEWRALQKRLHEAGYAGFTFPVEYGGQGLTLDHERVFREEAVGHDLPNSNFAVSINILGATLAEFGTEEQKRRHLPRILSGDELWLQLLSEPSGGSDLAGLLTSATRDGDSYVVNGQKTWSSGAHFADYALCPVRTDWTVPKHQGISVLCIDLRSPGVEIRRIQKITGQAEFCEEFLTDVRVPVTNLVGEENEGWRVLKGLLEIEHAWVGRVGGRGDLADIVRALVAAAERKGTTDDPIVRRLLVDAQVAVVAQKLLVQRVSDGVAARRLPPSYGSILKLGDSPLRQRLAECALAISGSDGVAWEPGSVAASAADAFLDSRSATIAGGTNEIQRNNVSERVLGLPREPSTLTDVPFNEIPHN